MNRKKILVYLNEVSTGKVGANRPILYAADSLRKKGCDTVFKTIKNPLRQLPEILEIKPDAIIINSLAAIDTLMGPFGFAATLLFCKIPTFVYWLESEWVLQKFKERKPIKSSLVYYLLKNKSLNHLAVSRKTKDDIVKYLHIPESKVKIIHICIFPPDKDEKLSALNLREKNEKIVVAVGSTQPRKGTDLYCEAAVKILKDYPDARFYWLGAPFSSEMDFYSKCRKIIEENNCGDKFKFLGHIEPPFPYINEADVFVVPSRDDPLPLTGVEAIARGKHVISFNNGGMAEVLSGERHIIDKMDSGALAEKILDALNSPASDEEKQKWKNIYSDNFSPERFAEKLIKAVFGK